MPFMVATPPGRILVRSPTLLVGYLILAQNRPLIRQRRESLRHECGRVTLCPAGQAAPVAEPRALTGAFPGIDAACEARFSA